MAAPVAAVRAARAVLALCAWVPIASAQEVPPPAYQLAAQRAGIPSPVLFAVALQESGARLHGRLIPWPWTLNVAGQAERYATRAEACAGLRRPGAASLDLCYVAAGWYDGFFETGLAPWDIAAGSLIVAEAGGLIGNFTGEGDFLNQREVIAGNPKIFAQLVQMLNGYSRVITPDEAGTASTSSSTPMGALAAANAAAEAAEKAAQKNALSAAEAPQEPATTAKKPPRRITRDEFYIADEAFFTGTAAEVTPIRELDNRTIGSGSRGPVTTRLQSLFFETVSGRNAAHKSWLTKV